MFFLNFLVVLAKVCAKTSSKINRMSLEQDLIEVSFKQIEYLKTIKKLLLRLNNEIISESEAGSKNFICWDWDMIVDYMNIDSPKGIFAGVLQYSLDVNSSHSPVVILEGTIKEMTKYLWSKARRVKENRLASFDNCKIFDEKDKSKNEIEISIDLMKEKREIKILSTFLKNYSTSLDELLDNSDSNIHRADLKSSKIFNQTLSVFQNRHGKQRNEADALNISLLKIAEKEGLHGHLITGTSLILDQFPDFAVDPFYQLVCNILYRDFPQKNARERCLNDWIASVSNLLSKTFAINKALDRDKRLSLDEIEELSDTLKSYYQSDTAFIYLLETLRKSYLLAEDRMMRLKSQKEKVHAEGIMNKAPEGSLRAIEFSIDNILYENRKVAKLCLSDLGMSWIEEEKTNGYVKLVLVNINKSDRVMLTLEITKTFYSIYWYSEINFVKFLKKIEFIHKKKWIQRYPKVETDLMLTNGHYFSSLSSNKTRHIDFNSIFKKIESNNFIRSRIMLGDIKIFYEPIDTDINDLPNIAVIDSDKNFRMALCLLQETSLDFLPSLIIRHELKNKLKSVKDEFF